MDCESCVVVAIDKETQRLVETGSQLAQEGMQRTLEAEREEWIANALKWLQTFGGMPGWREFKTEDFRAWWLLSFPAPHSHHCWGALTNYACKLGVLEWTLRYAPSVSPRTHGHPVKVWRLAK